MKIKKLFLVISGKFYFIQKKNFKNKDINLKFKINSKLTKIYRNEQKNRIMSHYQNLRNIT